MALPLSLVAMGKHARHHRSFNINPNSYGMISDAMTVDCDQYIPHFNWRTDFPGIPHWQCTGDHLSIIVSVVGHHRFGDLCTDVVTRFLLPEGDDRQQRVIVLKDDYGMRTSWVVCNYLKDLLNSIMFGGSRQFNVETFLFYQECEQSQDMSRGYAMFCRAMRWSTGPTRWGVKRPTDAQYGRQQIYSEISPGHPMYLPARRNICQVVDLVAHHFASGDEPPPAAI